MIQSLSFKRDRIIWYDVAKGILILCVVLGHSEVGSSGFFNWFHMPLFFLLAGYALRLPERFEVDTWLIQKCVRLFIPYLFYSALYWVFSGEYSVYSFLRFVLFNAWGGRIRNVYTVNWYITCLFLSYVFMYIIDKMIKSNFGKILILCIMACLGIAESYLLIPPGGADSRLALLSMEC